MALPTSSGDPAIAPTPVERAGNGVVTSTFWANTFDRIMNWLAFFMRSQAAEPDGASMEIDYSSQMWVLAGPTTNRTVVVKHTTGPTLLGGERLYVKRPATGAFAYALKREGAAAAIVTLPASISTGAVLYYDIATTEWRLLLPGEGAIPGADAD